MLTNPKVSEINRHGIWPAIAIGVGALAGGYLAYKGAGEAADAQEAGSQRAAQVQWDMYQQSRDDLAPWREAGENALAKLAGSYEVDPDWLAQNPEPRKSDFMQQEFIKHGPGTYTKFDQAGYQRALEDWEASKPQGEYTPGLIEAGPGEFKESPGYQFTLQEGLNAQQNALSAMGRNRSGAHIKAATEYAEGLASTEYDNFLRRWYQSLTPYQSMAGLGQTSAGQTAGLGFNTGQGIADTSIYSGNVRGQGDINQANALTGAITGGTNQLLYYNALRNLQQQPSYNTLPGYNFPNIPTIRGGQGGGYGF